MTYLPPHEGLLPYWLLFMTLLAIGSTVSAYRSTSIVAGIYVTDKHQTTPLSSRTFGTWTLVSGAIRVVAAYRIDVPELYALTLVNFVISLGHFLAEWLWFGTTNFSAVWLSCAFEITTISWMLSVWSFYVK